MEILCSLQRELGVMKEVYATMYKCMMKIMFRTVQFSFLEIQNTSRYGPFPLKQ